MASAIIMSGTRVPQRLFDAVEPWIANKYMVRIGLEQHPGDRTAVWAIGNFLETGRDFPREMGVRVIFNLWGKIVCVFFLYSRRHGRVLYFHQRFLFFYRLPDSNPSEKTKSERLIRKRLVPASDTACRYRP